MRASCFLGGGLLQRIGGRGCRQAACCTALVGVSVGRRLAATYLSVLFCSAAMALGGLRCPPLARCWLHERVLPAGVDPGLFPRPVGNAREQALAARSGKFPENPDPRFMRLACNAVPAQQVSWIIQLDERTVPCLQRPASQHPGMFALHVTCDAEVAQEVDFAEVAMNSFACRLQRALNVPHLQCSASAASGL